MAAISEKILLLGRGLYGGEIPDTLTLKSIPTSSELDYVGSEDFIPTLLDKIFPQAIEEKCNFHNLLEIDFHWICRALRILNYGPYHTTNAIFCPECGAVSRGEYRVDLRTIPVKELPEEFENKIVIPKSEFITFNGDVVLKLPTIQEILNAHKDKMFVLDNGEQNTDLARMCYMIKSIKGESNLSPVDVKQKIRSEMIDADFKLLTQVVKELTDYGLRAGGAAVCPKCNSGEATFIALVDDRFFRPTLGDLRAWKADRCAEGSSGSGKGDNKN